MRVDVGGLQSGANTSYTAADHAHDGAGTLSRVMAEAGMFGDFAAARSLHRAVEAAHNRHIELIKNHTANLGTIGDKVNNAAAAFAEMDDNNGKQLKAVY